MSKSYKKTPRCGDNKSSGKKFANRRVRRQPIENGLFNHGLYKKLYCQWDICDYESVGYSFEEYWKSELEIAAWYNARCKEGREIIPNKKDAYRKWYRQYKMK